MALGKRIKLARERKGLTQAEVAYRAGIRTSTVTALEKRDSEASRHTAALARALEVRTIWLMMGEGPMELDDLDDIGTGLSRAELIQTISAAYQEIAKLQAENRELRQLQRVHEDPAPPPSRTTSRARIARQTRRTSA
jgi:transcriptional regulator with XRE-family HTH domain